MPYYGDHYAGDPGLFSFLGKAVKAVGKVAVGVVKATVPGASGVLSAVNAIRGAVGGSGVAFTPQPLPSPAMPLISLPATLPPTPIQAKVSAAPRRKAKARRRAPSRKSFGARMAALRRRRRR